MTFLKLFLTESTTCTITWIKWSVQTTTTDEIIVTQRKHWGALLFDGVEWAIRYLKILICSRKSILLMVRGNADKYYSKETWNWVRNGPIRRRHNNMMPTNSTKVHQVPILRPANTPFATPVLWALPDDSALLKITYIPYQTTSSVSTMSFHNA